MVSLTLSTSFRPACFLSTFTTSGNRKVFCQLYIVYILLQLHNKRMYIWSQCFIIFLCSSTPLSVCVCVWRRGGGGEKITGRTSIPTDITSSALLSGIPLTCLAGDLLGTHNAFMKIRYEEKNYFHNWKSTK